MDVGKRFLKSGRLERMGRGYAVFMVLSLVAKVAVGGVVASALVTSESHAQDYSGYYVDLPVALERVSAPSFPQNKVVLSDYGVRGDGLTLCTSAFAKAIEDLSAKGGGRLVVPSGIWLTGPIALKDNIELHLERNAMVLLSPDKKHDFGEVRGRVQPAIFAKGAKNIGVTGEGTIDGNGKYWRPVKRGKMSDVEWNAYNAMGGTQTDGGKLWFPYGLKHYESATDSPQKEESLRADLIRFERCENVLVSGVTIQNSPRFHLHPVKCTNVVIDGVRVRCPWNVQNGDGIDLSSCRRALIVNTTVDVGDDAICMKSGTGASGVQDGPCSDILVENCVVNHGHGGFVLGSDCAGGHRRMVVRNCTFSGTDVGLRFKSAPGRGGHTEDIFISDIVMNDISGEAVLFSCSYVDKKYSVSDGGGEAKVVAAPYSPDFTGVHIRRVVCREARTAVKAEGIEGIRAIHGIDLRDCTFFYTLRDKDIDSNSELTFKDVVFRSF